MSETELAARLAAHGHAFEGLLDLIPAKFYNPEDASAQWSKRKQTKEEATQAKRAKLDPDQSSHHSIRQNAIVKPGSENKREQDLESVKHSTKKTSVKVPSNKKPLQQRQNTSSKLPKSREITTQHKKSRAKDLEGDSKDAERHSEEYDSTSAASPDIDQPKLVTPDPNRNITDLRAKLAAKIEALRSKRKAPGSSADGAPKSRDAILEARRIKEDARRERKKLEKEARKDAAQEIKVEHDDEPVDSNDDNDDSSDAAGDEEETLPQISYGKVAFSDGDRLDADGNLSNVRKRKQQDTQSALQAALNKKARLAALPSDKQEKIADSDSWHKALLQADGEKVKDDLGKLKKAVKRQESIKKKSTKEWKERLSTIAKNKALKQKNREQNLKDRRDSKGKSGGHKKGKQIGAYQGKKSTKVKGKSGGF